MIVKPTGQQKLLSNINLCITLLLKYNLWPFLFSQLSTISSELLSHSYYWQTSASSRQRSFSNW